MSKKGSTNKLIYYFRSQKVKPTNQEKSTNEQQNYYLAIKPPKSDWSYNSRYPAGDNFVTENRHWIKSKDAKCKYELLYFANFAILKVLKGFCKLDTSITSRSDHNSKDK